MATVSKNQRAAKPAGNTKAQGTIGKFLIPAGAGTSAYVFNPATGKNPRLAVTSEEFVSAFGELAQAGYSTKLAEELAELHAAHPDHGWDRVRERLAAAGHLG